MKGFGDGSPYVLLEDTVTVHHLLEDTVTVYHLAELRFPQVQFLSLSL